jgi:hypothetical protein
MRSDPSCPAGRPTRRSPQAYRQHVVGEPIDDLHIREPLVLPAHQHTGHHRRWDRHRPRVGEQIYKSVTREQPIPGLARGAAARRPWPSTGSPRTPCRPATPKGHPCTPQPTPAFFHPNTSGRSNSPEKHSSPLGQLAMGPSPERDVATEQAVPRNWRGRGRYSRTCRWQWTLRSGRYFEVSPRRPGRGTRRWSSTGRRKYRVRSPCRVPGTRSGRRCEPWRAGGRRE